MQLLNCEAADRALFSFEEIKDMFIFEFCSLMNLGMYIIDKSFQG